MFNIGTTELALIIVVALVVLGPDKLPGMAKALRNGLRDFRKALHDAGEDVADKDEPTDKEVPDDADDADDAGPEKRGAA